MLIVHRAERADRLVDALADDPPRPLDDPFAPEIVSVPSRGIERWLTQQLSNVLGRPATSAATASAPTSSSRSPARSSVTRSARRTGVDPAAIRGRRSGPCGR